MQHTGGDGGVGARFYKHKRSSQPVGGVAVVGQRLGRADAYFADVVHSQFGGFPLLGDDKYGIDKGAQLLDALGHKRLCLHARTLVFPHPDTGKTLSITAPLDEDFEAILAALRGNQ